MASKIDIESDEILEKIHKYVNDDMTFDEKIDFLLILSESEDLQKEVNFQIELNRSTSRKFTFDDMCAAYDNKDWEEFIRLGEEMEALGYSEEVHPIRKKVGIAKSVVNKAKAKKKRSYEEVTKIVSPDGKTTTTIISVKGKNGLTYTATFSGQTDAKDELSIEERVELFKKGIVVYTSRKRRGGRIEGLLDKNMLSEMFPETGITNIKTSKKKGSKKK